ncbi:hypothetical protein LTR16_005948, partial [Cryomyces antarcticus]
MLSLLDQPFVKDVWLQLAMPPNTQDASFATELRFSLSWETSEDVFERLQYAKVGPDVVCLVIEASTRADLSAQLRQSPAGHTSVWCQPAIVPIDPTLIHQDVLDRRTRQDQQPDGKQSDDLGHGHEGIVGHDPR